jgi:tRNA 2-selenouridine synthase
VLTLLPEKINDNPTTFKVSESNEKSYRLKNCFIVEADEFLKQSADFPIIDVRSPKEYQQGHIPGSVNLPVFDDDERAIVGIIYAKEGRDAALLKGLEIVGPKLEKLVVKAGEIAPGREVLMHCWRGGMRSESLAWLLSFSGIKVTLLYGGYKAYRRFVRASFQKGPPMIVLGGMTGSGKTEILHHLADKGLQVLDLEQLACHKGSAFGALGMLEQPTSEQFENDIARRWLAFQSDKLVWLEDESRSIGRVFIPEPLFIKKVAAPFIFIEMPFEERVTRLEKEYGNFNKEDLAGFILKISRRMGRDKAQAAVKALKSGNVRDAIVNVLSYYDKTYTYSLERKENQQIASLEADLDDLRKTAKKIIEWQKSKRNYSVASGNE